MNAYLKNAYKKNARPSRQRNAGFSMLEVLIALVIILTGVLGALGIQMTAISNAQEAKYKSIAALLASSMAAQMQANLAFWATTPTVTYITIDRSGIAATGATNLASAPSCASQCTAAQMATVDLTQAGTAISNALPGASHSGMLCNAKTPTAAAYCDIFIYWNVKDRTAVTNAQNPNPQVSYQTRVVFN